MSSSEISNADLNRLICIGTEDYVSTRAPSEKKLGIALWNIIELERQDTDRPLQPGEGNYCSFMRSREARVGPNVSALVMFKADSKFLNHEKEDWLLHVSRAALHLHIFLEDLPHSQRPMERSELLIAPKRRMPEDKPAAYRDVPHIVTTEAVSPTPLPVPDTKNTILILDKIAREYPIPSDALRPN